MNEGRAFPGFHVTPFPSFLFSLSLSRHIRRFASHLTEKSAECKVTPRSSNDEEKPSAGAGVAIDGVKDESEWDLAGRRAAKDDDADVDGGDLNRRQSNCQPLGGGRGRRHSRKKSRWHFIINVRMCGRPRREREREREKAAMPSHQDGMEAMTKTGAGGRALWPVADGGFSV